MVMFYSALLGATLETRFNLFQSVSSQTNTHYWYIVPLNFVSIHVPVVRQHCALMEGFALSHIMPYSRFTLDRYQAIR